MDAGAYLNYGRKLLNKGAVGADQEDFHHTLHQQPDFPEAYNILGIIQQNAQCPDKAEALVSRQ